MRKQTTLKIEIGDANYVKPGEFFGVLSEDGTTITSIKKRKDDLTFEEVVATPAKLEAGAETKSIAELAAGDTLVIEPGDDYDGLSKVTITFTA